MTKEELKLTQEEAERFKEAFKDRQFVQLFDEYVREISDPANRKVCGCALLTVLLHVLYQCAVLST